MVSFRHIAIIAGISAVTYFVLQELTTPAPPASIYDGWPSPSEIL